MLKNVARNLLRKPRALRVELEKCVQWWEHTNWTPVPVVNSSLTLGAWEHSWQWPELSAHSLVTHGCTHPARPLTAILAPGLQMFLAGHSCFRPLTTLMVRADFHLMFCESDWVLLKSMQKEQREDQGPGWWPPREAQSSKGDKNDSQKVLISVKITTMETKEVTHEKYVVSVQTGDNCFQIPWKTKLS